MCWGIPSPNKHASNAHHRATKRDGLPNTQQRREHYLCLPVSLQAIWWHSVDATTPTVNTKRWDGQNVDERRRYETNVFFFDDDEHSFDIFEERRLIDG